MRVVFFYLFSIACILYSSNSYAQENGDTVKFSIDKALEFVLGNRQDTAYIENLSSELSVRLLASTKYNYFKIRDRNSDSNIIYRPDNRLNFGLGVTYKIFSLDVAFNVGLSQNRSEEDKFKNSRYFDFVGSVFTSRHFLELSYRYYFGHYLSRSSGLSAPLQDGSRARDDIRAAFVGIEYLNALNFGRFSFKAPFVNNEIQKKSAGSVILGVGFGTASIEADSSMVPPEAQNDFDSRILVSGIYLINASINAGYMYSFVRKGWYATVSAIPGIAIVAGDYKLVARSPFTTNVSFKIKTLNAIGYNGRRMYGGLHIMVDILGTTVVDQLGVEVGRSKAKLFVGYRFKGKDKQL